MSFESENNIRLQKSRKAILVLDVKSRRAKMMTEVLESGA
jgi:hypothetical protein